MPATNEPMITLLAVRFRRWAEHGHFRIAFRNLVSYMILERGMPIVEFISYLLGGDAHSIIDDRLCFDEPFLRHFIHSCGDTAIDIGAGEGYFVLKFAKHARAVYAYEPNPQAFQVLRERTALLKNVVCQNVCLGEQEGEVELFTIPNGWGFSSTVFRSAESIKVRSIPLDSVNIQTKVSLIKIDCEGAEVEVLAGASNLISRDKPLLLIEVHGRENLEPVKDQLKRLEYQARVIVEIPSSVDRLHRYYLKAIPSLS